MVVKNVAGGDIFAEYFISDLADLVHFDAPHLRIRIRIKIEFGVMVMKVELLGKLSHF